jgi:ankyrin repeat protein
MFILSVVMFPLFSTPASAGFCFMFDRSLCSASCSGDRDAALERISEASENDRVCALALAEDVQMQSLLLDHGVSPSTKTTVSYKNSPRGRTALFRIIKRDELGLFENLLKYRSDVNVADVKGTTALMLASAYGRVEMVRALINAKASVNARDRFGSTALCYAENTFIVPNRDEIVSELRGAGAVCE